MSIEVTSSPKTRRLESWKEIAAYLGRDVTTVRRWEKREGLPVYRLQHSKLGSVYAYTLELDAWRDKEAHRETLTGATDARDAATRHQPARIRPVRRWLVVGGVAVVGLLVAAYLSTRSRAYNVTEEDTVVVTDFANSTGDAVFDGALRQGLSVQLQQSPFLRVVSDQRIRETLRLMGKPEDARLGPEIAKDLCVRVGSKVYIAGSIANFGKNYVIGLQAVSCSTGDLLAQEQVQEPGKEKVLDGLSRAAGKLRETLGESISSVQKFDTPLAQATTPSLEALRALSIGRDALADGNYPTAVSWFQRAIIDDSDFALAYASLWSAYSNLGENNLAQENVKKAFELRGQVSERERLGIEAGYYWGVAGDLEKTRDAYQLIVQTYPRDSAVHFNLGNVYQGLGQLEEGLAEARESFRLDPNSRLSYSYLTFSLVVLDRLKEAEEIEKEALAKYPAYPLGSTHFLLASLTNNTNAMSEQLAWATGKKGIEDVLLGSESEVLAFHGQLKKSREQSRRAALSASEANERETAAGYLINSALADALFGNREAARKSVLALRPFESRDLQYAKALVLALVGETAKPQALADNLATILLSMNVTPCWYVEVPQLSSCRSGIGGLPWNPYFVRSTSHNGAGDFGLAALPLVVRSADEPVTQRIARSVRILKADRGASRMEAPS